MNDTPDPRAENVLETRIEAVVARGPSGTFAVAGVATVIVVALYFVFYFFVYLPRGVVQ